MILPKLQGGVLLQAVVYRLGDDGVNDAMTSALKRAFESVLGREVDLSGRRWILSACERIERGETTMDMEVRRLQNRSVSTP